jgi:hypothetical protein
VKFLVDMPLSPALAGALTAQGHDAVHASTAGLDRASDAEILVCAGQDGRTVITADLDYPRLLALCRGRGPEPDPIPRRRLEGGGSGRANAAASRQFWRERHRSQHHRRGPRSSAPPASADILAGLWVGVVEPRRRPTAVTGAWQNKLRASLHILRYSPRDAETCRRGRTP